MRPEAQECVASLLKGAYNSAVTLSSDSAITSRTSSYELWVDQCNSPRVIAGTRKKEESAQYSLTDRFPLSEFRNGYDDFKHRRLKGRALAITD
jgi:hypothetical protein